MNSQHMKKLNNIAHVVKKPAKPAPVSYKGASAYLDRNRLGIAKLRKRGFTWGQIADTFQRLGIGIDYNNLYQWQLRNFRQKPKPSPFSKGDMIQPFNKGKSFVKGFGIVASTNPKIGVMNVQTEKGLIEVPMRKSMFKHKM